MRKIFALLAPLYFYLLPVKLAFAEVGINPCPQNTSSIAYQACQLNAGNFGLLVGTLIQAVFVIAIIIALGYLIYGAVRWIISQGDKSKVTDARNHIIAAIIGLVIVFLSYFIINLVLGIFFNGASLNNLELPSFNQQASP